MGGNNLEKPPIKLLKHAGIYLVITLLLISTATVTANINNEQKIGSTVLKQNLNPEPLNRGIIYEDSFETYDDFAIDFPPWTTIDIDGELTYGHTGFNFTHENEPYAFMIFNPSTVDPPQTDPEIQPHTGDKYVVCWAVQNTLQNDDWLISPQLDGNFETVSFWAKSYSDAYNIERFEVGVSTTNADPANFTIISPSY